MRGIWAGSRATLLRALCVIIFSWLVSAISVAANGGDAAQQGTSVKDYLDEVVVTARRRAENLQDVPASVYAIGGKDSFLSGEDSMSRVRNVIPNFNFATDLDSRSRITVRGLGSDRAGVQPNGVGFYVDGVYQNGSARLNAPFLDIERVEVLEGPQGARYGRNAFAGVINIITRKPDNQVRASVQTELENHDGREFAGTVSGPLVPHKLYAKLAYSHNQTDGDYKYPSGKPVEPLEGDFGDVRLVYEATDDLELDLKASKGQHKGLAYDFAQVDSLQHLSENFVLPDDQRSGLRYTESSLRTTWKRHSFEVVDLVAYYDSMTYFDLDGNLSAYRGIRAVLRSPTTQWSDELRIQSTSDGPLHWLLGGEGVRANSDSTYTNYFGDQIDLALLGFPNAALAQFLQSISPVVGRSNQYNHVWSAFGEASYEFARRLELTVSLRYDNIDAGATSYSTKLVSRTFKDSAPQPLVSLRYRVDDDTSVYASRARGYRQGGFNSGALTKSYGVFRSDDVTSYEVGLKRSFPSLRGHLDLAAFYEHAGSLNQFSGIITDTGTVANGVLPLGGAVSKGVEGSLAVALAQDLKWTVTAGWLDCKLTDIPAFASLPRDYQAVLPAGTRNGSPCLDSSKWTATTALDIAQAVGGGDWNAIGNITLDGRGDTRIGTDGGTPITVPQPLRIVRSDEETQRPVYLLDANFGLQNRHWTILVYGENLTNKLYATDIYSSELLQQYGLGGTQGFLVTLAPRRRFGFRLRYDF